MLVFPSNPNSGDVFAPGPGLPSWIWDGDKWTRGGAAAQFALEALADVAISEPAQGEMLAWDATAEKWVNAPVPQISLVGYATQQYVHDAIAAIPAPPTPSLASLTDTSLANLAAGQALTWSGSQWVNANIFAEPVKVRAINGGSGVDAFAVTNSAQTEKYFWVRSDGANYLRSPTSCVDAYGVPIWETLPSATAASLQVYASQNSPGISISQNVPNSSFAADWLLKVIGNTDSPSGTSYGMYMRAGNSWATGGGDTAMQVANIQGETIFQLVGDGQFRVGPPYGLTGGWIRSQLILDWMGNMTLGMPSGQATNPSRMVVQARDSQIALRAFNSGGEWVAVFANSNTAGNGYGVFINAGVTSIDWTLYCTKGGGSPFTFGVRGDGILVNPTMPTTSGNNAYVMAVGASNEMRYQSSSARVKHDVHTVARSCALEIVARLRTVSYRSKCECDDPNMTCYGLLAEEVAAVDPGLVSYRDGKPASVAYDRIAMLMLPLLRDLLGLPEPGEHPC